MGDVYEGSFVNGVKDGMGVLKVLQALNYNSFSLTYACA